MLQHQARHVPQLVRQPLTLLDRAPAEADVLGRGHLQQPVAGRVGAVPIDRLERVDPGAEALRHPPAVDGEHGRGDDHVGERDVAAEEEAGEEHPVLPQADDLAGGDVHVTRVVARELGGLRRPAERGDRPQRRREPGVEDVLAPLGRPEPGAALGAAVGRRPGDRDVTVGAAPDRQLMTPPELPREAPVGRVLERVGREAMLARRVEARPPLLQRVDRGGGELIHPTPPLAPDERLDPRVAALAGADRVPVALAALEPVVGAQPVEDLLLGRLLRQPLVLRPGGRVHPAVVADHHDRRTVGPDDAAVPPDLEVRRVVAGRDLQRAGAELRLDAGVREHRHHPADHRDDDLLADRVPVAGIVRMHGDGHVGEDRRRASRRDGDRAGAVDEGVADVRQRVVLLDVLDLEIGERGPVMRAPVDDPVGLVDPAAIPEKDEVGHDGLDVGVVHGETLARVVERAAETAELAHDHPAGAVEPLPRPLDEGLAADLLARRALGDQLLLDHVLGRDACVVVARLPERVEAPHPVPADEGVLHRAVQGVPEVELAGDVRRRHADDEALAPTGPGTGPVEAFCLPGLLPAPFDVVRLVPRLHHRSASLASRAGSPGSRPGRVGVRQTLRRARPRGRDRRRRR